MTHAEKIEGLREEVTFLFEKEGRSRRYIAQLFNVKQDVVGHYVRMWELKEPKKGIKPSDKKFINKHKLLIKSRLDNNIAVRSIAKELCVADHFLHRIIDLDDVLRKAKEDFTNRKSIEARERLDRLEQMSSKDYSFEDIQGEIWKDVLGYEGNYMVSNFGRVKSYVQTYDKYYLMNQFPNKNNGRLYVHFYKGGKRKAFQVHRLVGHSFVEGYDPLTANTINHIDLNVSNNEASNLEWVSQSENNKHAYSNGRTVVTDKHYKKFKKIILDEKYEFKTVASFARFIGKSETQARRYLNKETALNPYKIEIIL